MPEVFQSSLRLCWQLSARKRTRTLTEPSKNDAGVGQHLGRALVEYEQLPVDCEAIRYR